MRRVEMEHKMMALTDNQQRFVDQLVTTGCTPTAAARLAGYSEPSVEASRLARKPHVVQAIREAQGRLITTAGANLALKTMCDIMGDVMAPASSRVSAARSMMEAAGMFDAKRREAELDVPLHEMTAAQLDRLLVAAAKAIDEGLPSPVITIVDDEPAAE
jgi:hypothetical protein